MKELQATITSKGQVTIPAEVRQELRLHKGDKVTFAVREGEVLLRRMGSVVDATAGIFKSTLPSQSAEELREVAADAIAEQAVERA